MQLRDERVDVGFVARKEGMDARLVQEAGALGLGQDEVGKQKEAKIGVKREPLFPMKEGKMSGWKSRGLVLEDGEGWC